MDYRDYYKILGVDKKASQEEIKKQYRKLAVKHHPDKNKGNKEAEDRFKEISEAYQVLGNPENRKKYDQLGANWKQYGQGGFQDFQGFGGARGGAHHQGARGGAQDFSEFFGSSGFSDFFEAFFGGTGAKSAGFGGQGGRSGFGMGDDFFGYDVGSAGNDLAGEIHISIQEAYHGTTRIVDLGGEKIRVKIKPGAYDGLKLRIRGKGEKGRSGQAGDLYLTIKTNNSSDFERMGDDLYLEKEIDVFTAMLGGSVEINTLEGKKLQIRIPEGTTSGKKLRIKGKGMPVYGRQGVQGDLFVVIRLQIPRHLNEEQKDLVLKLKESMLAGKA